MHLSELRKRAGKSQEQVARDLGISVSTIIRHERGRTPLTDLQRHGYANYYGVNADSIEQPGRAA